MAQAVVHGAQIIMVRGNFDHCLDIARGLARDYPVALVNSVNPVRLQGQKTASFEIVRLPRRRARLPPAPGRQRRQHRGLLARLPAVRRARSRDEAPRDARLPGRGRRSARDRRAVPRPRDQGDGDPRRQPGVLAPRRDGGQGVRGPVRGGLRRPDPRRPGRAGPARRRLRRARLGRRRRRPAGRARPRGRAMPGRPWSSRSPATASRTPPPRWSPSPTSSTTSWTPTSRRPLPRPASSEHGDLRRRAGAGHRPGHRRPTSVPVSTRSGWRSPCATSSRPRCCPTVWSSRSRAPARTACRATSRTWSSAPCGRPSS